MSKMMLDVALMSYDLRSSIDPGRPQICLSLSSEKSSMVIDRLLAHEWRPVSLQITGEDQMLHLHPKLAIDEGLMSQSFQKQLLNLGIPILKWSKYKTPEDESISTLSPDYAAKGCLAAEHFAARGFSKVAYMAWKSAFDISGMQFRAFKKRAKELDVEVFVYRWDDDGAQQWWNRYRTHEKSFADWTEKVGMPIGIFCADDRLAALTCMYCKDLDLDVPVDVAILGVGERPHVCKTSPVGISHIAMNQDKMLDTLVNMVERLLSGHRKKVEHSFYAPQGVVVAESTDVMASADRNVAEALRYIAGHYHENLSVNNIAAAVGLQLHELQHAFKKELGRPIGQELRRKRLEVFARLLLTTDETIEDLRSRTGFFSPTLMFRVFKREYGTTPKRFRARMAAR